MNAIIIIPAVVNVIIVGIIIMKIMLSNIPLNIHQFHLSANAHMLYTCLFVCSCRSGFHTSTLTIFTSHRRLPISPHTHLWLLFLNGLGVSECRLTMPLKAYFILLYGSHFQIFLGDAKIAILIFHGFILCGPRGLSYQSWQFSISKLVSWTYHVQFGISICDIWFLISASIFLRVGWPQLHIFDY